MVLNAHVSWVERGDSVRVGSEHDEKRSDGEDQPERQREDEHRGSLFPTSNESAGDMPMRARGRPIGGALGYQTVAVGMDFQRPTKSRGYRDAGALPRTA